MVLYRVLYYPHALLKKKSTPITQFTDDLRDFIKNLIATGEAFDGGGIAAPQVGVNKRIFVCDFSRVFDEKNDFFKKEEGDFVVSDANGKPLPVRFPMVFINPEILTQNAPIVTDWEGCLSVPDVQSHNIPRFHEIEVKAFDEFGQEFKVKTTHLYAAVNFQHEIDHLDGLLMIDRWNKQSYSVKDVLAEIGAHVNSPDVRKKMKKLTLVDATKLKFL